jgi:cyclopropane fatty-acyl-phospholipid synthase-like methyltransferase
MSQNINSKAYWDQRFASNDWEEKNGRMQTEKIAKGQIKHFSISNDFDGTIMDFGCGLGDAIPVYWLNFLKAKLMGIDISQIAIDKCNEKYGEMATFIQGDFKSAPEVDVIIASNVFEHRNKANRTAGCHDNK